MKTNTSVDSDKRVGRSARWCRLAAGGILLAAGLTPMAAQNRLYVQGADNNFHMVYKVSGGRPYVAENGQVVPTNGDRYALKKIEEYLPIFVTVRDQQVTSTSMHLASTDDYHNNQFHYRAKFESADALDDVFMALEMDITNVGKRIYVYGIGHLDARTPEPLEVTLPMGQYLGAGQVTLHLFVGGAEVLQSEMPEQFRQEQLDRMVAKRVASMKPATPKPFFGSMPAYPAALRQTGLKGTAVVTMVITAEGKVIDPVVDKASEAPFGDEALAAVRQWRFLPRVVDGRPVETRVSMPFAFDPPPTGDK